MDFLQSHVTHGARQVYTGEVGLKRTRYILHLLKDPQNELKIIHIAGTSGKGSTAYFINDILESHGFKTGLNVSPHIVDIRERFQICRNYISKKMLVHYLSELIPYFEQTGNTPLGYPTYFEILTVLSFYIFHKNHVDYAVIETGMGGLLDATNVVTNSNKVSVLTNIGYDHTNILGHTLKSIAENKAGIVQSHSTIIAAWPEPEVLDVFNRKAAQSNSTIEYVKPDEHYTVVRNSPESVYFDVHWRTLTIKDIKLSTPALFQVQNAAIAIATVYALSQRDVFTLSERSIKKAIAAFTIPARMEFFHSGTKTIIVDGAHNEQKMKTFVGSLQHIFPGETFDLLIAFKASKDITTLASLIIPLAHRISITSFFHLDPQFTFLSAKPSDVARTFNQLGYNDITIADKPYDALVSLLKTSKRRIVVTGSFYLIGELYDKLRKLSVDNTTFI
ncbi:MAG: hypothetical protein RI947_1316 [Candidatus Parcubacteria bacterium]|jgi:dihydrofolate synthase/folylpolyglutamate synthase